MTTSTPRKLWFSEERKTFLIPEEISIPPGPMVIRSVLGEERRVDPSNIASYEISEANAKVWLNQRFDDGLQLAKEKSLKFFEKVGEALATALREPGPVHPQKEAEPMVPTPIEDPLPPNESPEEPLSDEEKAQLVDAWSRALQATDDKDIPDNDPSDIEIENFLEDLIHQISNSVLNMKDVDPLTSEPESLHIELSAKADPDSTPPTTLVSLPEPTASTPPALDFHPAPEIVAEIPSMTLTPADIVVPEAGEELHPEPSEIDVSLIPEAVRINSVPPIDGGLSLSPSKGPERSFTLSGWPLLLSLMTVAGLAVAAWSIGYAMRGERTNMEAAVSPDRVATLETRIEALAAGLNTLNGKVEGWPKPISPIDLTATQLKIDNQIKTIANLVSLTEKQTKINENVLGKIEDLRTEFVRLNERVEHGGSVNTFEAAMKSLRGEIDRLNVEHKQVMATVAELKSRQVTDDPALLFDVGVKRFLDGQYKEAYEIFGKLVALKPQDARIYYYAALANGVVTGNWVGDTEAFVKRGVELERAGSPKTAEIDAAVVGIPDRFKPWLSAYRQRAY